MKRVLIVSLITGLALLAAAPTALPPQCQQPPLCRASACATVLDASSAAPLPYPCPRSESSQDDVDVFAWNLFIAWNWPATKSCKPDTTRTIGASGPVLWQTQMSADDLFVAPDKQPAAWCSGAPALFANAPRPFRRVTKTDPSRVVTDRNGRWLRYEKLVNEDEYLYIRDHHLWTKAGLGENQILFFLMSAEFEAAWKVLTPAEIASRRYYTTLGVVSNTPEETSHPAKNPVTLGLVGLHIAHKGPNGWFWATFEHVDAEKIVDAKGASVKRITPIAASSAINAHYQSLLARSVFANYRLVSTEWPSVASPKHVANITMETFAQQSGCVACHAKSKWDGSFVFNDAK